VKTVIITGANSGIGKEATKMFAKEGYKVIMACRNMDKGKKAKQEIIEKTMNNEVYLKEVDLASFDSIRSFCNDFRKEFKKLDILIHNAAYFNHGEKYRLSPDNIELTFATNVFGPFLMTNLLIKQLKAAEDPRILHAVSNIIKHFFSPKKEINFDNIQGWKNNDKSHSVYKSYRDSKMALTMLTFKLAQEFEEEAIKINALQINGAKMSKETIKKFKPLWRPIARIQNLYFPEPEIMAKNYFEICTSDKFKNVSGKLFNHRKEIMEPGEKEPGIVTSINQLFCANLYPRYANREDVSEKIWNLSRDLTGIQI